MYFPKTEIIQIKLRIFNFCKQKFFAIRWSMIQ